MIGPKDLFWGDGVLYNSHMNTPTPPPNQNHPSTFKDDLKQSFKKGWVEAKQQQLTKWVKIKLVVSLAFIALLGGLLLFVGAGIDMQPYKAQIIEVNVKDKTDTYNWKKWVTGQMKKSSGVKFVILEGPFEGKELGMVFYDLERAQQFKKGDIVLVDAGQGRISWFTPTSNMRSLKETATDEKN